MDIKTLGEIAELGARDLEHGNAFKSLAFITEEVGRLHKP